MSEVEINGTITFPTSLGGPNTSPVLGMPVKSPSDTDGPKLTYNEKMTGELSVVASAPATDIPFGTVSSADCIYVGSDQEITLSFNSSADLITIKAGGFAMIYLGGITAAQVIATTLDAKVQYMLFGD